MKSKVFMLALALAAGAPAALAALGNNGLFLEVWNGNADETGASYIKDLGVSMDAFMNAPACFNHVVQDLGDDPKLQALAVDGAFPATLTWTVQGYNNDNSILSDPAGYNPQDPLNHFGFLTLAANPDEFQDSNTYMFSGAVVTDMDTHLNSAAVIDAKGFLAGELGYYQDSAWGPSMNNAVAFTTYKLLTDNTPAGMYFLTVDSDTVTGVLGANGAALGSWNFNGRELSFTPAADAPAPDNCPATTQCDLPWGGKLTSGTSVTAYQNSDSADCEAGRETRRCANGVLAGSFTHQSCTNTAPKACDLPWGGKLASGQSVAAYQQSVSANCEAPANKETRTCDNGTLSGGFTQQACSAPKSCDLPWGGKLASGQSVAAYQQSVSANCEAPANKETRACDNGTLSGGFTEKSCGAPKSCDLPWGGKIASGQSVPAYQSSLSEACDSETNLETRVCDNGTLSGGFGQKSCSAPKSCDLPWGETLPSGQSVTAYQSDISADCEASANQQTRTCDNGKLSGGFTKQSCSTPPNPCDLPWGGQLPSGQSVAAYQATVSAECDAADNKEIRACDNGVLSGNFTQAACAAPSACDLPWGGKLASGQSVTAYRAKVSIYCDALKETRACDNGVLGGGFDQPACAAPTGTYLWMIAPNGGEAWKTGIRQYIEWTSGNLAEAKRLNLYFSKDGGKTWGLVKRRFKNLGHVIWTPGNKHATETALIRLCTVKTKQAPSVCATSEQAFSVAE